MILGNSIYSIYLRTDISFRVRGSTATDFKGLRLRVEVSAG